MKGEVKTYDFGIIGSGPAGYSAAIRASQLGKSVVLFEKKHIGGTCLNNGCIPTKTFLHSVDVYNSIKRAPDLGIEIENVSIDFEKMSERKDKTVEKVRKSLEMLLKSYDIEIVTSQAKIIQPLTPTDIPEGSRGAAKILANDQIYICENVIVATGSEPKSIGDFEFDHKFILNSDDVLDLKILPKKMVIVGSGAIGIEWARIFSSLGTEVSIVEFADKLLPLADFEISQRLERMFKKARVKMYLSTSVEKIENKKITLSSGEILEPDFALFATGRIVKAFEITSIDKNIKPTSSTSHNDFSNIRIIGDAFGSIQLAHFASHQGIAVVENIINNKPINEIIVPLVIYGNPEIAWVGKTEQELIKEKIEYKKSLFPIAALGKAQCEGNLEGFVKVLSNENKIVGAHIISKEASAMIHQLSIAMQNDISVNNLKECCFAHPTYSEAVYESILGLDGESLSLLREQKNV